MRLLIAFLFPFLALGQYVPQGFNSNGNPVTVFGGGTMAGAQYINNGNNGNGTNAMASPFLTPTPSSGAITVNGCAVFVDAVDAAATTGCAIYNMNVNTLTQVVVCTGTNTPVTGCATGDAEYIGTINGSSSTYAANQRVFVYGFNTAANNSGGSNGSFAVAAYNAAYLILANSSAVAETHAGTSYSVGSLLCGGKFGSTPTNDIFNFLGVASLTQGPGCSTLSSNTWYASTQVTSSATQNQGTTGSGSTCPNTAGIPIMSIFTPGTSVSANAWPTNLTFNGTGGVPQGDGCYASYVSYNFNTTAPFTVIQAGATWSTTLITTLKHFIAPVRTGHTIVCGTAQSTNATPALSCNTATNGTAADTLTQRSSGTNSNGYQISLWTKDGATSGANQLLVGFTNGGGGNHQNSLYMEIAGPATGGSFDASAYDTVDLTSSASFTSASSITTTHATEFLLGIDVDEIDCTGLQCYFAGTSGWTSLVSVINQGSGGQFPSALFIQSVTSTGTYNLTGKTVAAPTFNHLPGLMGLHQ